MVLALAAVEAPVPPFANAMVVPLHIPLVIVPKVIISVPTNFEAGMDQATTAQASRTGTGNAPRIS